MIDHWARPGGASGKEGLSWLSAWMAFAVGSLVVLCSPLVDRQERPLRVPSPALQ